MMRRQETRSQVASYRMSVPLQPTESKVNRILGESQRFMIRLVRIHREIAKIHTKLISRDSEINLDQNCRKFYGGCVVVWKQAINARVLSCCSLQIAASSFKK